MLEISSIQLEAQASTVDEIIVYTTYVNGPFRVNWLASSEMICFQFSFNWWIYVIIIL